MRYSGFRVIAEALTGHKGWKPVWRDPTPQADYDFIIIGGGGHGLATAYYLAKEFGQARIAVLEKGYLGGGNVGRNTTISVTEQTDAWVVFDLAAADLTPLLERLCNVDFGAVPTGYATRTVMEHLGVYLIKLGPSTARIYGPRSSAESLLHALETAAYSDF